MRSSGMEKPHSGKLTGSSGSLLRLRFFCQRRRSYPKPECKAYDLGVHAASCNSGDKVAVIAIDDQSIATIGRWPWSREVHAKMIDLLATAKVKVIGNAVFFSEPQVDTF
ncbi:MAG: CHASE2 domain-containing protein [Burkholderiales bacterium]